jgi:benzaldehyde dehydrogenase (NAD)
VFLDPELWRNRIFVGGSWVPGAAGTINVKQPATGEALGEVGLAGPSDVAAAAESAAKAQVEWAATPHPQRAAVLRRAAQL